MIEGEQSCFRVSSLNGSLEVSARLKSVDDLEILMRVLEANRALFLRKVRSNAAPVVTKQEVAEVDRTTKKGLAKAKQFKREFSHEDKSESEILTLT